MVYERTELTHEPTQDTMEGTTSAQDLNDASVKTHVVEFFRILPRLNLAVETSGDTYDPRSYLIPERRQRNEWMG